MNKAFANTFRGQFGQDNDAKPGDVPYAVLKGARHSGQLNISNRNLDAVPLKVWRINVDVPDEAKNVTLTDVDERWWDQIDLRKLIIASNQIKEIPDDIQHLPALTVLDAHDNQIETLSEELGNLRELFKLHLSHNKISKFPESFCNLVQLKCLLLTSNEIHKLPEDFGSLCNIEELKLDENKLASLPESFGNLKKLKKLSLAKNQIESFPSTFHNLTSLIDLDANSNKLSSLPDGFGKLISLSIFDCRNNQITKFTAFNEPGNIEQLFLGNNRITELDEDVFNKLPRLVTLDLRDNRISTLAESICNVKTLERIDLSNNFLSTLPCVMGNMSLKSLTLDGNPLRGLRRDIVNRGTAAILSYLKSRIPEPVKKSPEPNSQVSKGNNVNATSGDIQDDSLTKSEGSKENRDPQYVVKETKKEVVDQYLIATTKVLTHSSGASTIPDEIWLPGAKLTQINFSKNAISEFPEKIQNYADTLSELDLSKNKIQSIPSDIGSLKKLTYIDLSNNMISSLPEEINQLVHLLQITLTYNRFTKIPPELFSIPKLQTILIQNNQISEIDVPGLLQLKALHTLDLSNNNIDRIPPELGNVEWLKSLTLDGNCFRNPRAQIMTKGTQFILAYLRDRIPR